MNLRYGNTTGITDCPCSKDCPDRKGGCHSPSCPHGWFEWDKKQASERAERAMMAERALAYKEVKRDCIKRMIRR